MARAQIQVNLQAARGSADQEGHPLKRHWFGLMMMLKMLTEQWASMGIFSGPGIAPHAFTYVVSSNIHDNLRVSTPIIPTY